MTWMFAGLVAVVAVLALADLFLINPRRRPPGHGQVRAWSATYVLVALLFNAGLFFAYDAHWFGLGQAHQGHAPITGVEAWQKFLAAFLMQTALGLDSVFTVAAVFEHFRVPPASRRRVLLWGVFAAMAAQWVIIWAVGQLFAFTWARVFIAVMLVLAAVRMLLIRSEAPDPSRNWVVRILRMFVPVAPSEGAHGGPTPGHAADAAPTGTLLTRVDGRVAVTPLVLALVVFETADAIFALDGVPAVFAVTREPLIVFAACVWAGLVLRSVYDVLAASRGWIRYIKVALALILLYSAVLFALPPTHTIPVGVTLIVLVTTLGGGFVVARALARPGDNSATTSALGADAEELARRALRQARRVQILLVGTAIVLIGIFMLVGPGPGLIVIPIGLAMLATEFAWARQLLDKYSVHAQKALRVAGDMTVKKPRPELVPPVLGLAVGLALGPLAVAPYPTHWVLAVVTPIVVFAGVWSWTNLTKHRELTVGLAVRSDGTCPACMFDLSDVPRSGGEARSSSPATPTADRRPFQCPRCNCTVSDRPPAGATAAAARVSRA